MWGRNIKAPPIIGNMLMAYLIVIQWCLKKPQFVVAENRIPVTKDPVTLGLVIIEWIRVTFSRIWLIPALLRSAKRSSSKHSQLPTHMDMKRR
jgi:hypothetical protein